MICLAWSTDPVLRRAASSGGFTRAMLRWMLETNVVDGVLCARTGPPEGGFRPEAFVATDPEELADRRTASVYYPTEPLAVPLDPRRLYAATLLPCQVEQLRAMQKMSGGGAEIGYVFELLCNYLPRREWTEQFFDPADPPEFVAYRGGGFPGKLTVDGRARDFQPLWEPDVRRSGMHRCWSCTRTCGAADWTVADPWGVCSKPGDGKTLVRVHTEAAKDLFDRAVEAGAITYDRVDDILWEARMEQHARRRQ